MRELGQRPKIFRRGSKLADQHRRRGIQMPFVATSRQLRHGEQARQTDTLSKMVRPTTECVEIFDPVGVPDKLPRRLRAG